MTISSLIEKITPLYSNYKNNKKDLSGSSSIKIMWEIGDHLKAYIEKNSIAPHKLYREIYGKSEGKENITQRSYITREFLGRCYRIRNLFNSINEIDKTFPTMKYFNCFREAMPFFDNKKFILKGAERDKLINLLNSDQSLISIMRQVKNMQKEKIGIKNPRTQKLHELEEAKNIFITFYNYIYNLTKSDYAAISQELNKNKVDSNLLDFLIHNTSAISQDGLKYKVSGKDFQPLNPWGDYLNILNQFISSNEPKAIRRFRRLIRPERIVRLADMLHALTSESSLNTFNKS